MLASFADVSYVMWELHGTSITKTRVHRIFRFHLQADGGVQRATLHT